MIHVSVTAFKRLFGLFTPAQQRSEHATWCTIVFSCKRQWFQLVAIVERDEDVLFRGSLKSNRAAAVCVICIGVVACLLSIAILQSRNDMLCMLKKLKETYLKVFCLVWRNWWASRKWVSCYTNKTNAQINLTQPLR